MTARRRIAKLVRDTTTPLGAVVTAPVAAVEVAGSVWRATRGSVAAVTAVAESLPRLARQAETILDAVRPPAQQVATALDVDTVDRLVLAIKTVPEVLAAVLGAVGGFEVFVVNAEATRDAADLTVQRAAGAVTDVNLLIAQTAASLDQAAGVVAGGESLVRDAQLLTRRVSGVVDAADGIAVLARQIVDTAAVLIDMTRPAVELWIELSRRADEPARILLEAAENAAPKIAAMAPDVLAALDELSDRLPDLLRRVDSELLPTVRALQRTPGDVRALRDSVEEINPKLGEVEAELAGLPGAKALRRRGRRAEPEAVADPDTRRPSHRDGV